MKIIIYMILTVAGAAVMGMMPPIDEMPEVMQLPYIVLTVGYSVLLAGIILYELRPRKKGDLNG